MSTVPKFQITPDQEELDRLQRELRFFPSRAENPQRLTRAQVQQFNEQGFLTGIRIFDDNEITDIRRYFDRLLEGVLAEGKSSYSISTAHLYHGRVYDILREPRIVACVKDLLGPDVIGWGSHFFCKLPRDKKSVAWHQDASYWPLSVSKTVTVWLAIDDADTENGCMRFVPRSHLYGQLEYRSSGNEEENVLNQTVENPERFGDPVNAVLKAGEISMHSDLLLHGSEANNSSRRRCGLTLRYCSPDVRAGSQWHIKGVVVSGSDPSGHWANPPRPDVD